jgi:16S rRNA (cytidine1402-2'-O)-methyltransferase
LWFERVKAIRGTIVFFEAPHRIQATLHDFERELGNCQVAVARELTKLHEELVRGPIKIVAERLSEGRGEFTVVVNIGQITENIRSEPERPALVVSEFGETTKLVGMTRRKAINVVARKHGLTPNRVYEILEEHKKSG